MASAFWGGLSTSFKINNEDNLLILSKEIIARLYKLFIIINNFVQSKNMNLII